MDNLSIDRDINSVLIMLTMLTTYRLMLVQIKQVVLTTTGVSLKARQDSSYWGNKLGSQ
jgi:hypothetical protein